MAVKSEAGCGAAELDEWSYRPAAGVGPLQFRMALDEVVEAAEIFGRTQVDDCARDHTIFSPTWKVDVQRHGVTPSPSAVTAYVSQAVGLFCVAVDAVHGPQVVHDGLALVGRDLSELESDAIA